MADRHNKCVFGILKNCVFKFGLNRKNIKGQENERNQEYRATDKHDVSQCIVERYTESNVNKE